MRSAEPTLPPRLHVVPAPAENERTDRWDWLATALLAAAFLPFAGLAWLGHWPERDLGIAAALGLFAARQLVRPVLSLGRRSHARLRHRPAGGHRPGRL